MKLNQSLLLIIFLFVTGGLSQCGGDSSETAEDASDDSTPTETSADLSGKWVGFLEVDGQSIADPVFFAITQTGTSMELTDACDQTLLLATGTVGDGTFEAEAPDATLFIANGTFEKYAFSGDMPGLEATWSGHRLFELTCEDGMVVSSELMTEINDPANPPSNATDGLAHLNASRGYLLPTSLGPVGAQGDETQSCTGESGAAITCPDGSNRDGYTLCTMQSWGESEIRSLSERVAFIDDQNVFPGALLQGKKFSEGSFVLVDVQRAGGNIVLNGLTLAGGKYDYDVPEMTFANVSNGIASIIGQGVQGTAANVSLDIKQAFSSSQMAFSFGVDARFGSASLAASLNIGKEKSKNTVVLKFTQVFYRVSYDPPPGSAETIVFKDGDAFADPNNTIGANNPPLYVSSVSYGRQVFFAMTSQYSSTDIEATLQGAYSAAPSTSISVSSGLTYQDIASSASVAYVVRGGGGQWATTPISAASPGEMYDAVKAAIAEQKASVYSAENPGAPIAYTLKYLLGKNIANMSYSVVYDQNDCVFIGAQPYELELHLWNVDYGLNVYKNTTDSSNLLLTTNSSGDQVINLTGKIGEEQVDTFIVQMKNSNCGHYHGNMELKRDSVSVWTRTGMSGCCNCWQWGTFKFTANKSTGGFEFQEKTFKKSLPGNNPGTEWSAPTLGGF